MVDAVIVVLVVCAGTAQHGDWPALIQRPFEGRPVAAQVLPPLFEAETLSATPDKVEQARGRLRERWMAILGEPPAKPTALNVQSLALERLPDFNRETLSFETEGGDRLTAALLTPQINEGEKRPAVVVFHETTPLTYRQPAGLAGDSDRHFGVELARRGYVVLCPECFILKPFGAGTAQKNVARARAVALKERRHGWTGIGKLTFDASRCVDYLESLTSVDKDRIGCLGFSLGAKEVLYAMAFDPRFRAGVANEGGVGIRMSNWSDEWYLGSSINEKLHQVDHHQLLALTAPRPLLIQGGGSADGEQSWPYIAAALPVFRALGAGERLGLHDHGGKHTYPRPAREVAYRWLDDWLRHQPKRPAPSHPIRPPSDKD